MSEHENDSVTASSASVGHVEAPKVELPPDLRVSRTAQLALVLALLPILSWGACVTDVIDADSEAGFFTWVAACVLAGVGAVIGFTTYARLGRRSAEGQPQGKGLSLAAAVLGLLSPVITFFLGLATLDIDMTRGRRLVRRRRSRQVETTERSDWHARVDRNMLSLAPREVARAWRDNAATEHASIASFAHLSNQLLALGAPASLVRAAHEDALDEIRHAELCYALADGVDGGHVGPAAFPWAATPPESELTVPSLAADALVEACLLETASAVLVSRLARREGTVSSVRAVLKEIAADEGRHGAHGWDIIEWALSVDEVGTAEALRRAWTAHPGELRKGLDPAWAEGQLLDWGIPSSAMWAECYAEAWSVVNDRLGRLLRDADVRRAA